MTSTSGNDRPLISLENVGVYYSKRAGLFRREKTWVLRDVSVSLYAGDSLGVIGRNGAGKTTMLKLLAGIMAPNRGVMVNNGATAQLLTLSLGFVPYLSGIDNVFLSGMLLGMRKREIAGKISEITEFSGLGDFMKEPVGTYSSGMKARLGFSIAFQINPDVLLVDEVLGVGDAEFREKSRAQLEKRILSQKTIVFVSHDAPLIKSLCNRAVWIEDGVSQIEGDPSTVLRAYYESGQRKLLAPPPSKID